MPNQDPNAENDGGSVVSTPSLSSVGVRAASGLSSVSQLSAGHMDGDGAIDLVVETANGHSGGNGVIFGQTGSLTTQLNGGSFASAATNGPAVFKFAGYNSTAGSGDINNDGFTDIISATGSTTASIRLGGTSTDNVADQNLSLGIGYSPSGNPIVADFNGDGHADLFMSAANSSAVNGASATSPALAMWLGNSNGSGIANTPTATAYSGITPVGVASLFNVAYALGAVDLNDDGYADIVTNVGARNDGQANYGPVKVTFGNSGGSFASDMSSSTGGVLLSNFDVAGGDPLARSVAGGGDVNGDGRQDLLGWNEGGTGGFALFGSTSYTAGSSVDISALNGSTGVRFTGTGSAVTEMVAGDLNGDGLADIVVGSSGASSGAGKLWVVWGKEGGFSSGSIDLSADNPALFTTLTGAASQGIGSALAITDMNGDGHNDLVVGSASGTIDVVSGETFEGMLTTPLKCYSTFEDKPLTLSTSMLLGNDSDPDSDPLTIQSVQGAVGGAVAFDLDGNIVFTPTANHNGAASFTYTISDGNGGTDTATVNLTVKSDEMSLSSVGVRAASGLSSVSQLSAGHMDGDGAIDLVVETANGHSGGNGVIFGQTGSLTTQLNGGSFASAATNGPAVFKFAGYNSTAGSGDINNDGFTDIINATGGTTASIRLGGTSTDNVADQNLSLGIGYSPSGSPIVADFNGDGHADLFMSTANSSAVNGASATSPALAMWLGSGSGIANTPTATAYSGVTPVGVASLFNVAYALGAIDLNDDGYADIVTNVGARNDGQANYGPVKVTFGNSGGSFASDMSSSTGGVLLSNFDVGGGDPLARSVAGGGDVNGDGRQDLLGWNEGGTGGFALFGSTSYTAGSSVDISALNGSTGVRFTGTGSAVTEMVAGDLNGDGLADIVVGSSGASSGAGKLWVVWGKEGGFSSGSIDLSAEATGQFITITGAASQGIGSALAIADIDGDGHNDLVVGSSSGTIDVIGRQAFPRHDVAPVAQGETLNGTEDQVLNIAAATLLANDSDADGDALEIASVGNAVGGTVVLNENGSVTFTPEENYNGEASFDYAVSDGCGGTANATATINLAAVNDAPIVSVGSFTFVGSEQVSSQYQSDITNFINVLTDTHETAALPEQYRNGTGPITLDNQEREVIVHFHSEVAGNQSVIGFYVINSDGSFGPAQLVFPNASQTPPVLDPDDPNNPTDSYTSVSLGNLPAGSSFGLFMISNGAGNGTTAALLADVFSNDAAFSFVNGGNSSLPASLFDTVPPALMVHGLSSAPSTGTAINQSLTPIFHTAASANAHFNGQTIDTLALNIDGMQHVAAGQGEINDGANTPAPDRIAIGWEDLAASQNADFDFNDVILQVEVAEATLTQINPANIGAGANLTVTDVDQGDFEGAVFRISGGYVAGDTLQLSGAFSIDSNGDVLNNGVATGISVVGGGFGTDTNNPNALSFTGTADQVLYEQILRSITFASSSGAIGIRTCEISVTDEASVTSNIAVQHVAVGASSSQNPIFGTTGNDTLTGTAASDFIFGDDGNDTLTGTAGDDWLFGGNGNDTFLFGRVDGVDTLTDTGGSDSISFAAGITAWDISMQQFGNDLYLGLNDSSGSPLTAADRILLKDFYTAANRVETLVFTDGSSFDLSGASVISGGGSAETITSASGNDWLQGAGGNDTLTANDGNDLLIGGIGDDAVNGGNGNDIYAFGLGDGVDTLTDTGGSDSISFAAGISVWDIGMQQFGNDLYLGLNDSSGSPLTAADRIRIVDYYTAANRVETLRFADGITVDISGASIINGGGADEAIVSGGGNDWVMGNGGNDTLTANAGNDVLGGGAGNDTLDGGAGADMMHGGAGNDTYIIGRGDGSDSIVQAGITDALTSTDTLRFSTGVAFDQLWFRQAGNDLRIDVIGEASSSVYLKDWYTDSSRRIDGIETVDGSHSLSAANVANLVSAMSAFSPPTAGQMTLAAAGLDDDLNATLAANWA